MANELSAYEVVMTNGNETYLVGFTARKSGVGLRNLVMGTEAGKRIAQFIPSDDDVIDFGAKAISFLDWSICFSGYTRKDASRPDRLALPAVA